MSTERSLPVIMPSIPDQRWSCHSCGDCCRVLVGHLFEADRKRLDEQQWEKRTGIVAYVRAGGQYMLNKQADGACVFLDQNNRCRVHSEFGEQAKPLACRIFPFSVRPVAQGWQASFRFDCPSALESKGKPAGQYRADLVELVKQLRHPGKACRDEVYWNRTLVMLPEEVETLLGHLTRWIKQSDIPLGQRLVGAARLTATLRRIKFGGVRGSRFVELLDLLFAALPAESKTEPEPPTARQRGMLRQLAYVHAEYVSLTELRAGVVAKLGKRWQQLLAAGKFRRGRGRVPRLRCMEGTTTFELVEAIEPATSQAGEIESLVVRYLTARLEGRSVFGDGYYGWMVIDGLAALCLSIAVAGWLARHLCAARKEDRLSFSAVAFALGVVDRAATRLPSLGTMAERTRIRFLDIDDGIARLLQGWALTERPS